jgi:hypothetical protein
VTLLQIVRAIITGVGRPEVLPPPTSFAYSGSALAAFSTGSVAMCQMPSRNAKISSDSSAARRSNLPVMT